MTAEEVRAEARRFGLAERTDVEDLRAALKTGLERRWLTENNDSIAAHNAWVEKNGLPLEKYRLF